MDFSENQDFEPVQYCFYSGNTSCPKAVRSMAFYVIIYIFAAASVMLTICGNLVVIISISHFKQLHTPTNLHVLSLAVADFLIGLIVMPFTIIQTIETCWYFGDIFCFVHTVFYLVLTSASISSLVFIAIDRYFAVCHPFMYTHKITITVTWCFIGLSWLLSMVYTWAILFFKGNVDGVTDLNACPGDCVFAYNATWGVVDLFMTLLLPFFLVVSFYTNIFIVARRHARLINSMSQQISSIEGNKENISKRSERKAAKTLGIVIFVFFLCWVPYYICTLIVPNMYISNPSLAIHVLSWVSYFNSSLNPIIYALFYPWFQKSLKLIVTFKICSPSSSLINLFPEN
ncbi:trace amine-associated receptor 13c-like [Erpetoichthys calabaricus]|uniref:trace amine-associated receptor 13c-like n=1 Tax=Erpetoichthys calabaricus TaxID=27687 RepID=UPI0022342A73|nr:trace amine-associated receptor 13c-like [Erpetoichthys calabaricus]